MLDRMGKAALVLAMLAPGVAVAGPQEDAKAEQVADFPALVDAFDLPSIPANGDICR